jgi:hypothetical protein
MAASPATPLLDGLRAVPGGFGQPSFAAFFQALVDDARQRAAAGETPPMLLVMGEPLAGKSTFLSQLFVRLIGPHPPNPPHPRTVGPLRYAGSPRRHGEGGDCFDVLPLSSQERGRGGEGIRPYLVRWGDTIRAAKKQGVVAADRQFGDLTPAEFAGTSALLAEAAASAEQAARGGPPAIVVVEAPGVTMLTDQRGVSRGLDRGYSLARTLARHAHGFLIALSADPRVRDTHLGSREARLATDGPDVREATQLAANRIRQQVTDLLHDLAVAGKLRLPDPAPAAPIARERLVTDAAYRDEAVLHAYLPYLLEHDLRVPAGRAFIGLNGYLGSDVKPDIALLDAYDWTHRHFEL